MAGLPKSRFCPKVDRGTALLVLGSLVGVEVVTEKFVGKFFQ